MHDETLPDDRFPGLDPIEAYLDGDLDSIAARRFEARLANDADLAAELELARRVRAGLRALPRHRFPARGSAPPPTPTTSRFRRSGSRSGRAEGWRGALAAAALLAVAVATGSQFFDLRLDFGSSDPPAAPAAHEAPATPTSTSSAATTPTPAEVEQARRELEIAFAYLGQLGRKATAGVRDLAVDESGGTP